MATASDPKHRRPISWALTGPLVAFAVVAVMAGFGFRINVTESLPRGLYRATPLGSRPPLRGELVTFCPRVRSISSVAPYLLAGDDCPGPDGATAFAEVAKAVVGLPGDTVTVDARGVAVNGRPLLRSAPLARSRRGVPVRAALGTHVLGRGEYWAYSGRVAYSLDSRYYGPVSDLRSSLAPIAVF